MLTFATVLSVNASATVQLVCQVNSPSSNKIAPELTMTRIGTIQRQ